MFVLAFTIAFRQALRRQPRHVPSNCSPSGSRPAQKHYVYPPAGCQWRVFESNLGVRPGSSRRLRTIAEQGVGSRQGREVDGHPGDEGLRATPFIDAVVQSTNDSDPLCVNRVDLSILSTTSQGNGGFTFLATRSTPQVTSDY